MIADRDKDAEFRRELAELLNKHSREGASGTPDFILADYMADCLAAFDRTEQRRNAHAYTESAPAGGSTIAQHLIGKWEGAGSAPAAPGGGKKEYYREKLRRGAWVVVFTKTDGTTTSMECTLDPRIIPAASMPTGPQHEPQHLLQAYSLDRGGWRSFTVENVLSFYEKQEPL